MGYEPVACGEAPRILSLEVALRIEWTKTNGGWVAEVRTKDGKHEVAHVERPSAYDPWHARLGGRDLGSNHSLVRAKLLVERAVRS